VTRDALHLDREATFMTVRPGQCSKIGKGWTFGKALLLATGCWLLVDRQVFAQAPATPSTADVTLDSLRRMTGAELEAVYRRGFSAGIADGPIRGTALLAPGTRRSRALSGGARLVWQGKVFEPGQTSAVNRFFGMRVVRAQVYQGPSWLDGQPSLILDYSQTSRVYANNRDEIRQVGPGLYLGLMYDRTSNPPGLVMYFALEAP
jgi:hypothetical protein